MDELQKKVDEQAEEIAHLEAVQESSKDDLKKYASLVKDLREHIDFKD